MIRRARKYRDYNEYLRHQQRKTRSPKSRNHEQVWWAEHVAKFTDTFRPYIERYELAGTRGLCCGARSGAEVRALLDLGVDAIGVDLVAHPPYTVAGDIHDMEFDADTFDFVFTNVFDHAVEPEKFASEIQRVATLGAYVLLQLPIGPSADSYRAVEYDSIDDVLRLFTARVLESREIDWRGSINTEVLLQC